MTMTGAEDYYHILGVTPQATPEAIQSAFEQRLGQLPEETRKTGKDTAYLQLMQAYQVLSDPQRRSTYDALVAETAVSEIKIGVLGSRPQIPISDSAQMLYLLIDVHPPGEAGEGQPPLNLCLVIDRSTSMRGERLDHVKAAVERLVEQLGAGDTLSIVSFSDRADVVVPAGPVADKMSVMSRVRTIYPSGGTEIYQGLQVGMQELRKESLAQFNNHLLLLTDGHTYGDEAECLQLAQSAAKQGVDFSAFGIGAEWNDQFLDRLVAPSGGRSNYIESPTQIVSNLQSRIQGLGAIYARNVRLRNQFPPFVEIRFGFKLAPFAQPLSFRGEEIVLGNIEGRQPLSLLLELSIAPQSSETSLSIPLEFKADVPKKPEKSRTFKHQFVFAVRYEPAELLPPSAMVKAVRMLNMYRMNEKVADDVEKGQLGRATQRMRRLTTRLLEVGQPQLAQQAHAEAERLESMGALSPEGRKQLKYGTRSLLDHTLSTIELEEK